MSIMNRLSTIFRGNVLTVLEKMEDPEKGMKVIIEDMRNEITKVKEKVLEAATEEKMLKTRVDKVKEDVDRWQGRAELAVKKDNDDMAKEAIQKKKELSAEFDRQNGNWKTISDDLSRMKQTLSSMEEKYKETLEKKDTIIAQAKMAKARIAASRVLTPSSSDKKFEETFSRAQEMTDRLEAKADALRDLDRSAAESDPENKWKELESGGDAEIDAELAALKKKVMDQE